MTTGRAVRVLVVDRVAALWGAERVVLELGPRLVERGIEPVLAGAPDGPFPAAWREAGLEHVPIPLEDHRSIREADAGRSPRTIGREALLSVRVVSTLARHARSFDVLHSNQLFAHLDVVAAAFLVRRPALLHIHDLVAPGGGQDRVLRAACGRAAGVLVAANAIAVELGIDRRPGTHVLHPAHDLARFAPGPPDPSVRASLGAGDGDLLVGMVGRLDRVKGIDVAIRAISLADDPRMRLAIVGSAFDATPQDVAALRDLAERELGDRVRFVDTVSDVVPLLRSLDVLVNASHLEPFGTSIAEAQACARAVVATDVGGVSEHVNDGVDGLLVPPADSAAMAAALRRLAADPDLRNRLGLEGRRTIEAHHDIEAAADCLAAVYRAATSARGAQASAP